MTRIARRRFLEQVMLTSAATTACGPVARLWAAEPAAKSANEKLNVAVIGVRGRGQDHARGFAAIPGCEVTCICECDRAIGPAVVKKIGEIQKGREPKFVEDLRRVFDDPSVDIVSIATPNHWHALAAIWAMQAGKDVYVEKPVSHNVSEGRRMVQVARKYNRICQGGTQYRSFGPNREAAKYVAGGKLGKVGYAHCYMYRTRRAIGAPGAYQPPESVDYNLWAGPAPMTLPIRRPNFHYDWHWIWDYGCGELGNNSVHPLDTLRMILGGTGLGRGVLSYGARHFDDAGETPNTQVTIHGFEDMVIVQEVRNLKSPAPKHGGFILVEGSEGYLVSTLRGASAYRPDGELAQKFEAPNDDHFANFVTAVRSRKMEDLNAEIVEGHLSTAIVHVGNISQRLGQDASAGEIKAQLEKLPAAEKNLETFDDIQKHLAENGVDISKQPLKLGPWLAIDSDRETFVDSDAANAMLTRDYREPFVVPPADKI